MKIRPLQDRIIVERIDEEETSKGGIIIPDTAKEKSQEGKVVAVGKGKVLEDGKIQKLDVKKGDRVLFSKYAGTEITLDGEERVILREDDVLGLVQSGVGGESWPRRYASTRTRARVCSPASTGLRTRCA